MEPEAPHLPGASAGASDTIRIWNTEGEASQWKIVASIRVAAQRVWRVRFDDGGQRLAALGNKGQLFVLDSVPSAERIDESERGLAAADLVRPYVDGVLAKLPEDADLGPVRERLRTEASFSAVQASAAVDELRRRGSERRTARFADLDETRLTQLAREVHLDAAVDGAEVPTALDELGLDPVARRVVANLVDELETARASAANESGHLNDTAWLLCRYTGERVSAYEVGLRTAERVLRAVPGSPGYQNTRGVILYRLGDYDAALKDLQESRKNQAEVSPNLSPVFVAPIALALYQLGRPEEAAAEHRRSDELMMAGNWRNNAECQHFQAELEALAK